ncbi:TPA: START domain-containing protein [Vibrio alginolyticus]|uniref:START domain-containing protein n=1 Tax=Vibrio TaxID=662 RepID=UPI0014823A21|nr:MULTISPECIES: START domain-containing protein [Vibrio]EHK9545443.1 START domain-containing protein [Vibrio alginolyticus]EHK9603075.1 START domain-containing protein [Vibrio alginolyticus]EJL6791082.1 START domain-containing protein [Vibrio alginolyticus]ELA7919359.1 START domain-containing protein [Vibrio alginolyticus]ELA7922318.1 START domain-containing protein [Vibrio alginolyticus]
MMLHLRMGALTLATLISAGTDASANENWQFESDKNGITIYSREHSDGLVEIRARMFTPTSYGAFLTLLEDSDNIPNWIDNASHSRVLNQISATENIVYTQFKAPWPAKNRDMVTYSKYWVDELGFTIEIKSAPDSYIAEQNGYVRIRSVDATWELQKLTNDTTLVEYKAFADPGGLLPNWLINKLSKESAWATFSNLRKELPEYQQYSHPQIDE